MSAISLFRTFASAVLLQSSYWRVSECKGFGNILIYDEELIIPDKYLSSQKARQAYGKSQDISGGKADDCRGLKKAGIDNQEQSNELSKDEKDKLFKGHSGFLRHR